uniref:CopG family transcriptional regulator n=1 Tax=Loa loa TaxID=7209 RepID=A0A1I7W334_LOALO
MKKQSKNCKNNEEANISPKTVAAMVADDSIRDTYMMCKEHTSPSVRMLTGMVGIRKYESRRITFGVQTLFGNVKNIQAYIVDSILERGYRV